MKALITGCAGFIGSSIADHLLQHGYEVTGIDCFTDYYSREIKEQNIEKAIGSRDFTLVEKDILDMDSFPEVDYVFHEAAQAGVRASWGKSFEIYTRNNIEATQHLLEYYKNKSLKKFIYASSSSVYGDVPLPMREDVRLQPISPYGVTKLAAEHLCYLYWKNHGVPTISLRYFTVYGPRQRPDMAINKFVKAIQEGEEITVYGDGLQTRDFTYISDVVEGNLCAAQCKCTGEVFNIGGGSRITVKSLIGLIEQNCGKIARIQTGERQKGDATDTLADTTRARKILGWRPEIAIEQGMKNYIGWINTNRNLV